MDRNRNLSNLKLTFNFPSKTVELEIINSHSWSISSNPYTDNIILIVSGRRTKPANAESGKCQIFFFFFTI